MRVQHISAFTRNGAGGNPAGVVITATMPDDETMQQVAREVGHSETVFVAPQAQGSAWRVRYFSPESEVPFCGHATIALGAALTQAHGPGVFSLQLNEAVISVEGRQEGANVRAELRSPPTHSTKAPAALVAQALETFGYSPRDLDRRLPPRLAHAGADHLVVALASRQLLARLTYDLDEGRTFMNAHGLVTVAFVYARSDRLFDARNAFASGGVLEDPATGAAAAAFAGMLRDIGWAHGGQITILQGEDIRRPSELTVSLNGEPGAPVHVSGHCSFMEHPAG